MSVVAYLTHPLGELEPNDWTSRGENIANAMQWFRLMIMTTRWVIWCPWFVYLAAVDDVFHRPRAMTDQVETLLRSDVMVMCGGRLSPHMRIELGAAQRKRPTPLPVLDLLDLGRSPPWAELDKTGTEIRRRGDELGL